MLSSLQVTGLRGFANTQTLTFAVPAGDAGSGLTIIVGANNSGKSTVIEALRALGQREAPSFSEGRRNRGAGNRVELRATAIGGGSTVLSTVASGGSETSFRHELDGALAALRSLLVLPSRRVFAPFFGRGETSRADYMRNMGFPAIRSGAMDQFTRRLFAIEKNRASFDALLGKIVDPPPDWLIEQAESGQYFLKITKNNASHSSEGLGEGLVSLLYIVDALHDSSEGDTIAIDEPELSLHPALQRKLAAVLTDFSATRQIVISTHSPYFVDLEALSVGAIVARVHENASGSQIDQLSDSSAARIGGLMRNENNPHVFGLSAREIFFADDKIVLVEGQEDVLFFRKIERELEPIDGTYFGWGVGGADNMRHVAVVLQELGFTRVAGVLDGNRLPQVNELAEEFPGYYFAAIAANDIRSKPRAAARQPIDGLLDDLNKAVRPEYFDKTRRLIAEVNAYLKG